MSRLSCALTFKSGMVVPGLRCDGFSSHFSMFSGLFGTVLRKVRRPYQWASEGPLMPSAFGTPGITWQELQECIANCFRPNCGSPPVTRAPRSKSKSRNQLQDDRASVRASRMKPASVFILQRLKTAWRVLIWLSRPSSARCHR